MKRGYILIAILLSSLATFAQGPRKVISAVRVDKGPIVDGSLEDECWRQAEVRWDYEDVFSNPVNLGALGKTELRLLTDSEYLYVGIDVKVVKEPLPKFELKPWKGDFEKIEWSYLHEIFLDPGRTMTDHYQYCVRADQTCMAQFSGNWTKAKKDVKIATKVINDHHYQMEFAFPAKGQLKPGMVWGFRHDRTDRYFHSTWYNFSGASNTPQLFAPLLIGSYEEWFNTAFDATQKRILGLKTIFSRGFTSSRLDARQAALNELKRMRDRGERPHALYLKWLEGEAEIDRIEDQRLLVENGFVSETLIRHLDFDEWQWVPIDFGRGNEMLAMTDRGDEFYFDVRGPMLLKPVCYGGGSFPFPVGKKMTEGAFKGCSMQYGPQKVHHIFFQHGPTGGCMRPDRTYRYSFWIKGKGKALAQIELHTLDKTTNKPGYDSNPARILFDGELPGEWTEVKGIFKFPEPPEGKIYELHNGLVFTIPPGTEFCLDEVKIWERDEDKLPVSWCALGTSITWYNENVNAGGGRFTLGYQSRILNCINFAEYSNCGCNSGMVSTQWGKLKKADIYTIEHGINDWGHSVKPGALKDYVNNSTNGTFAANYRVLIDKVRKLNPKAVIILCTPRKGYGFGDYLPKSSEEPKNGIYLKEYAEVVRAIARHEGFLLADFYAECGENEELSALSIDVALHPNDSGYERMAQCLMPVMKKALIKAGVDFKENNKKVK